MGLHRRVFPGRLAIIDHEEHAIRLRRDYTIAGGKAELCFSYQKPQPAAQQQSIKGNGSTGIKSNGSAGKGAIKSNGSTGKGALSVGMGVVGLVSNASRVYNGVAFVSDVFDGPADGDFADVVGETAGELLDEVCVVS